MAGVGRRSPAREVAESSGSGVRMPEPQRGFLASPQRLGGHPLRRPRGFLICSWQVWDSVAFLALCGSLKLLATWVVITSKERKHPRSGDPSVAQERCGSVFFLCSDRVRENLNGTEDSVSFEGLAWGWEGAALGRRPSRPLRGPSWQEPRAALTLRPSRSVCDGVLQGHCLERPDLLCHFSPRQHLLLQNVCGESFSLL